MFRDSPPITPREQSENDENKRRVVNQGRQPDLQLWVHNREQPFRALAHELFDEMAPFAEVLDNAYGGVRYTSVLAQLRERITHPDATPSAQVLEASHAAAGIIAYVMEASKKHKQALLNDPLDAREQAKLWTAPKPRCRPRPTWRPANRAALRTTWPATTPDRRDAPDQAAYCRSR